MMLHLHQWLQWLLLSILVRCSWTASAVIIEHATDILEHNYDFIVVGGESLSTKIYFTLINIFFRDCEGGTAGLAVANRLTEDPSYSVLVIEAGGSCVLISSLQVVDSTPKLLHRIHPNQE